MFALDRLGNGATAAFALTILLSLPLDAPASGGDVPAGHYLSLTQARNLQTEMTDLIDHPQSTNSDYRLGLARDLDAALRTPGVKGLWMEFRWRELEVADGQYDWSVLDANMAVARRYGLEFIVKIADRSFDDRPVLPDYFPSQYVLASSDERLSGFTAKRWDPYVYNRLIRLYQAIARRYAEDLAFGGIATTETATGSFSGGDYTLEKYRDALIEIVTRTQAALTRGKLFFYMNFIKGGIRSDMNEDARVAVLRAVPHDDLVVGGPDITPDVQGMPRSVTAYRIHVRKTMPALEQFCHLQNVDQGKDRINVKSNQYRKEYLDEVARIREREEQPWFDGEPAALELDDLRDSQGNKVTLHPQADLGALWTPEELFSYGRRNFQCSYVLWHYREFPAPGEFTWSDVRSVITANQCFADPGGCSSTATLLPQPPSLR